MPHTFVRLTVHDFDSWKPVMDNYAEMRREAGSLSTRIFRSVDEPNEVGVIVEWESLEKARDFYDSLDQLAGMEKGGVLETSEMLYSDSVSTSEH